MRNGTIAKVEEAVDQRQNILKLVGGRFQIAIGPRLVMRFYAKESGNLSQIREFRPAVDAPGRDF
jgi:polar amino acid transport system substrate-binding protein